LREVVVDEGLQQDRLFDKFGLARAPVIEGGKIVGIVSDTDMVMKRLGGECY
jgi:CBS domain-containing protein